MIYKMKHFEQSKGYTCYRWRVVSKEFKKYFPEYNFDDKQSNKYFLAVRKNA
jgi:hypothetical protein